MLLINTPKAADAAMYRGGAGDGAAVGSSTGVGAASSGIGGAVTAGVISGMTDIITGFINAGRVKQTAKFNSALGEIQTRLAKASAKFEIARIRKKSDSMYSTQRALYAKSGVSLAGSPAHVMAESMKNAEMDAFITDLNADLYGNNVSVQNQIGSMEAAGAYGAAGMNAGKSILTMGTNYLLRG